MSEKLLSWFEKRRQSETITLAQRLVLKAIDTISELEGAINAFCVGNTEDTKKLIEKLFQDEVEIDELRRAAYEELTKGELPPKYREDLKSLIERLDRLADYVKDSARSIKILVEAGANVPKQILDSILDMAKNLTECAHYLNASIEMLGNDANRAKELAMKVDAIEDVIDENQIKLKILFIRKAGDLNASTFMVLKDLVDSMEQAADTCADTADYIRTLSTAKTKNQ